MDCRVRLDRTIHRAQGQLLEVALAIRHALEDALRDALLRKVAIAALREPP
jgi:hypothetical protein